jgi:acyl-CoA reductase-like NAD-dependent aldehyde dehydrogenase
MKSKIVSRNPRTLETLKEIDPTPLDSLPQIFDRAKKAQALWEAFSLKKRARTLSILSETLLNNIDSIIDIIHTENGKPRLEALSNDIVPSLESIRFFSSTAQKVLSPTDIPLRNPILLHRKSVVQWVPLGVVCVIAPWNFPFFLPFAELVMAIVAGNAVVFKPSEVTPQIGLKIQELFDASPFPPGLVQTVLGDGSLGAALIEQKPNKIFFTGSPATGKRVGEAAAKHLIPVNLELGGKEPMLILPDADLDLASSAALWSCHFNSGQVCASTERILIQEKYKDQFLKKFSEKIEKLRPNEDLGAITLEKQKAVYRNQLEVARSLGVAPLVGGEFNENNSQLKPTVFANNILEQSSLYREETFGPIVSVVTYNTIQEAIEKANDSDYGLGTSIMTSNIVLGKEVASQIRTGTVVINDGLFTAGVPQTPWGGPKNTGSGKKHSAQGLFEFVYARHINTPRFGWLSVKSPWWFPYSHFQFQTFKLFTELYRKSVVARLRAVPLFLWNFVQMLKREKRL